MSVRQPKADIPKHAILETQRPPESQQEHYDSSKYTILDINNATETPAEDFAPCVIHLREKSTGAVHNLLIDTGASTEIYLLSFLDPNITIKPLTEKTQVRGIAGHNLPVAGECILEFEIGTHILPIKFLVIDDRKTKLSLPTMGILGRNFLYRAPLEFQNKNSEIRYKNAVINLLPIRGPGTRDFKSNTSQGRPIIHQEGPAVAGPSQHSFQNLMTNRFLQTTIRTILTSQELSAFSLLLSDNILSSDLADNNMDDIASLLQVSMRSFESELKDRYNVVFTNSPGCLHLTRKHKHI